MFTEYRYLIELVGALALLVAAFIAGVHVESDHTKAKLLAQEQSYQRAYAAEAGRLNSVAATYETKQAEVKTVTRTIVKRVETFIDRPIYKNTCLDADGLKAVNDALAGGAK